MNFVAIDFETANHLRSSACSIGIAIVKDSEISETKSFFIRPIPNYYATINKRIHGISEKDTDSAPSFIELWNTELKQYLTETDIVAHNAPFEKSVFNALSEKYGIELPTERMYCSLSLSRYTLDLINYKLDTVCDALGISFKNHHNALADAIGSAEIVLKIAKQNDAKSLEQLFAEAYRGKVSTGSKYGNSLFNQQNICRDYIANEDAVKGKAFCFTGTLSFIQRNIAQQVIENAGGIFKKNISSKVDYLVVGDLSLFGDDYESGKIKELKKYREKGSNIELLTEEQFQEMVIYEGPRITRELVEMNSKDFLNGNRANALYGKGVCISEGFDNDFIGRLSLLGVHMGPTHYEDEALLTDYYIISTSVLKDLFENETKSPSVLRMELALRNQLDPNDEAISFHRLKCIDEDTIREFIKRRDKYEIEVANGIEPKSMILR